MKKILSGIVTRTKNDKTCRVEIKRLYRHPKYGKIVHGRTVCHVHDESNECQIGDVVVGSDRACPCGRGLPVLERIEGREADYVVTPSGSLISGISLTENFALLIPGTAQLQVVQESLHLLRIRLVADEAFGLELENDRFAVDEEKPRTDVD